MIIPNSIFNSSCGFITLFMDIQIDMARLEGVLDKVYPKAHSVDVSSPVPNTLILL